MNIRHFFLLVLISISFSCSKEKVILEKEVDVKESIGWIFNDSLSVDFSISDTNRLYAMRLQLNHTPDFNFENVPQECTDRKMVYLNASSDIFGFVSEIYESCDPETSEPIKLKDIYEEFKSSTVFKAFTKNQQRELNYSKFSDKIRDEPAFKKLIKKRDQYHKGKLLKVDCLIGFKREEAIDMI